MSERYRLSFTTGGLFLREATTVVERYLSIRDWKAARDQVRQENLLQVRTAAAATRISKEVTARLELLDDAELEALQDGGLREQAYLLWVAACRRYTFIREFARKLFENTICPCVVSFPLATTTTSTTAKPFGIPNWMSLPHPPSKSCDKTCSACCVKQT